MLMLREPLLFLLLMCFCNKGKSETDIKKIQTAETIQDDSYCATFDETSGKCYNFRQKRSPLDENATTESASIPLGSAELNNETVIKMEINTDQPISSNTSINASTTVLNISELNSSDVNNSSTDSTTVITYTDVNSTNSTSEIPENIFNVRNDSQNCSTLPNKNADNSTDTQFELTETNNELTLHGENYTESRIKNSSQTNYSGDVNNTINIHENLGLTNLTAETQAANLTSNYTSETFTTEDIFYSTTDRNARRKREIQNSVTDENESNGCITQNSTESYSVNPVEYNNVTSQNVTLLKDNDSEFNSVIVNSTESTITGPQNNSSNLTTSNYNVTDNADNVVNSSNIYMNKNETNSTDFEQTIKENVTTNFTDNGDIDINNTLTENVINITDIEGIMMDQNQHMITKNATNNLTESVVTNVTVTNSTDGSSQNTSDENERLKRGIDSILIHTAQNKTDVNTTSNTTDVAAEHNNLTESSPVISTSQSAVPEAEKACLIQGEECTNSTECCEHFECTMFDFIKWSKNCDFKPEDTQLTSPPPDVRIPKQPIQLQQAL